MTTFSKITLTEYEFSDFQISNLTADFLTRGINLFKEKYQFDSKREGIVSFFSEVLPEYIISQNAGSMLFVGVDCNIIISYSSQNNHQAVLYGTEAEVKRVKDLMFQRFGEVGATIDWVYNQRGDKITLPLNIDHHPIKEFYPFLGERSLEEYYDDYANSNSSILVLIGPSGTGKTTFVRGLIAHTNGKATLSYDPKILENDEFFADFIGDDSSNILVIEDADNFIRPREDGNMLMMKFLNIGGGLVSSSHKKIIFTTNLSSIKEIDEALIRPGRCFDILYFDKLTPEESQGVAEKLNFENTSFVQPMTLAEIFNSKPFSKSPKPKKVGFNL